MVPRKGLDHRRSFHKEINAVRDARSGRVYSPMWTSVTRVASIRLGSGNTWGPGSIYGTVEFQFSWADLVKGQNIYWVEAMNYRPNAYRLLLTPRRIEKDLVVPYDPAKDEGPLRLRDGNYYWNGAYTSEFMIEDDLALSKCTGLDFVSHNPQICRPFGKECSELQEQPSVHRTGAGCWRLYWPEMLMFSISTSYRHRRSPA
jgi:hypothetical protein